MNLIDFVKKWQGRKCDFDGHFGAQCVDLFRQYCKEVLNVSQCPSVNGAKDLSKRHGELNAVQLYNGKEVCPNVGDVVVYDATDSNPYGHVAIVFQIVDATTYIVFEQDGYNQNGARLYLRDNKNLLAILYKES